MVQDPDDHFPTRPVAGDHPSCTATRRVQTDTPCSSIRVPLGDNLLRNLSVGLDHYLVDLERGLDGLHLVVHPLELLEGTTLGFDAGVWMSACFLEMHGV